MKFQIKNFKLKPFQGIASKWRKVYVPQQIHFKTQIESAPFRNYPFLFDDVDINIQLKMIDLPKAAKYVSSTSNIGLDFYSIFLNSFYNYDPRFEYQDFPLRLKNHVHLLFSERGYEIINHKIFPLGKYEKIVE